MTSIPLMKAAVDSAVFFGLCSDDVLNPDVAVRQLEALATTLQGLRPDEIDDFLKYIQTLADQDEEARGSSVRVDFLRSLGENLGINANNESDNRTCD
jgi:hypothetical protein